MKILFFTFFLLRLILSMDNENELTDKKFFLNHNYKIDSDTEDEKDLISIDKKKKSNEDASKNGFHNIKEDQSTTNRLTPMINMSKSKNLNPPLSEITKFYQEDSNDLNLSQDSTWTSPFRVFSDPRDNSNSFQEISKFSSLDGSWNESPLKNSMSSLNTSPFHGSKFTTSMKTSPFHTTASPIHGSSMKISSFNLQSPNENTFPFNTQPFQTNENLLSPFQFVGPNTVLNYSNQQENIPLANPNQDWFNDSIFTMESDTEDYFENPQFTRSKSHDEKNFELFPIFAKSKTVPIREKTEKEKNLIKSKRLLYQTWHPKNNENQDRMKNELKKDYKEGAFRYGGKQVNVDRAKTNLRFFYAEDIEEIKDKVMSECIRDAPLPDFGNSKTIMKQMHDSFNDAQKAQKIIDPYKIADYIPFMKFLTYLGNLKSIENMEPEEIILSNIGGYYLFTIYFKLCRSKKRLLFDI